MSYTFVKLPTGDIEIDHIREMYEDLKDSDFKFMKFKPRAALIEKKRGNSWLYTGQSFDPKYIELVEDGWTHDHCQICSITITSGKSEYGIDTGYFDGADWVCESCYDTIILADDLEEKLSLLSQYQK